MSMVYFNLAGGNFFQDWSNTGLITTADNWDGVASIVGYRGDGLSNSTATNPQTVTGTSTVVNVIANQTNPNTLTTGGIAEFQIANPTVALQGSGTADAPYLALYLDATGRENVTLTFNARDIDGAADNAAQQIAVQYRIGDTGAWIERSRRLHCRCLESAEPGNARHPGHRHPAGFGQRPGAGPGADHHQRCCRQRRVDRDRRHRRHQPARRRVARGRSRSTTSGRPRAMPEPPISPSP